MISDRPERVRYIWDISCSQIKLLPDGCHAVLVRVLQRKGTKRIYIYNKNYYKEFICVGVKAEESQELQTISWWPRRVDDTVPV